MPQITYGTKRLGILVPSGNSVAETELRAMLPDDVTMLTTRLALRGSSEPELLAMLADLDKAATLVGHAEPDAIAFHCTAVSTVHAASCRRNPRPHHWRHRPSGTRHR